LSTARSRYGAPERSTQSWADTFSAPSFRERPSEGSSTAASASSFAWPAVPCRYVRLHLSSLPRRTYPGLQTHRGQLGAPALTAPSNRLAAGLLVLGGDHLIDVCVYAGSFIATRGALVPVVSLEERVSARRNLGPVSFDDIPYVTPTGRVRSDHRTRVCARHSEH
jgi:hypothetical protein